MNEGVGEGRSSCLATAVGCRCVDVDDDDAAGAVIFKRLPKEQRRKMPRSAKTDKRR